MSEAAEWIPPGNETPVSASSDLPTQLEPMPIEVARATPAAWMPIGDWRKRGNPPVLGKPATSTRQIVLAPQNPASRFTGPVLSGEKDGVIVGSALLQVPFIIDATMGDFILPLQFEPVSLVVWMLMLTYQAFNGVDGATPRQTSVAIGSSPGGGEIFPQDGFDGQLHVPVYRTAEGTLPYAVDPNPFLGYITVRQYNASQGQGIVVIGYARV